MERQPSDKQRRRLKDKRLFIQINRKCGAAPESPPAIGREDQRRLPIETCQRETKILDTLDTVMTSSDTEKHDDNTSV